MKRFLIFASVCAFALTVFQSGRADVSINFFYDNLNGGNWYEVADYGYAGNRVAVDESALAAILRWLLGLYRCRLDMGLV